MRKLFQFEVINIAYIFGRVSKSSSSSAFDYDQNNLTKFLKINFINTSSDALDFVTIQGKLKLTRPIYRDLSQWTEMRDLAIHRFLENENQMHGTTAMLVRQDLKIWLILKEIKIFKDKHSWCNKRDYWFSLRLTFELIKNAESAGKSKVTH